MDKHSSERITLPSGRSISVSPLADPARPWEMVGSNGLFVISRAKRGDSSRRQTFYVPEGRDALVLNEEDATALIDVLGSRARGRTTRAFR